MPIKAGDFVSMLENKFGFVRIKGSGRNPHERLALIVNGKKVATTGLSRSFRNNTEIDNGLLRVMAREVMVRTLGEIKGMVTCTVSKEEYIEILRGQNYV